MSWGLREAEEGRSLQCRGYHDVLRVVKMLGFAERSLGNEGCR